MTVASDVAYAHVMPAAEARKSELFAAEGAVPMSIVIAFAAVILGWVGATVLFGLAGLTIGAEVMTLLAFVTVLTLTRA